MLLIQVLLVALNAIFASAEIAILSVNETKLAKLASEGNKRAKRLLKLTEQPARFLATIQVAITLAGFLGSAFAADHFSEPIVNWLVGLGVKIPVATLDTIAVIFITLVLSYFTLVFGELVPKRIAMKKAEKLALAFSGLITFMSSIFKPVVWFLTISNNAVLRLLGIDPNEEDEQASEEEIILMVDASAESGTIDHEEKELIQNVFEFDDLTAGEIATHRTDVDLLWLEESMEEWAETIHKSRHTLYPVCEDSADNVIGILNAKDYFRLDNKIREVVMDEAVRPAYFVPENIKADVLFRNMKKSGNTLAVVLDEYGGMVGIVTTNDLVECIVGDLGEDESDNTGDEPKMKKINDDIWEITGNIELDDIEKEIGIELDRGEFDTFTGLVFGTLGIIPDEGEQ
ncbi:MAG: HlyC/CorC family transporter, partial [Clostridia bacterium]|nr:HlyC/CorC family transporter [Clostridia bacterium]